MPEFGRCPAPAAPYQQISDRRFIRGKTAEKQLDFEACAVLCGLGERGLSGTLLTDDFGPFQRYVFVLTDAEIEAISHMAGGHYRVPECLPVAKEKAALKVLHDEL